jgi:hypothetical protein
VDRLSTHHQNGRRFQVSEALEQGATVALGLTISQAEWTVEVFKVFTFAATGDKVVHIQDCDSRQSALAILATG